MYPGESPDSTHERVTVAEAAERLGISEHAVRARLSRGTLSSKKDDEDGRVYVYVPDTAGSHGGSRGGTHGDIPGYPEILAAKEAQVEDLRAQLAAEREANRENRRIIMQQAQSLAAIEPAEGRDVGAHGQASPAEGSTPFGGRRDSETATPPQRRGFWARLLGR